MAAKTPARIAPTNTALQQLAQNFSIELAPFPQADQALAFSQSAKAIVAVTDKTSHQAALEAVRQGKGLQRGITDHWQRVLRWLEDRKIDIRNIRQTDLDLVEGHVTRISAAVLAYETAEKQRVKAEEDRQRRINEAQAQQAREKELAELARKAEEAEAVSSSLSARELRFCEEYVVGPGVVTEDTLKAARLAGYKDWQTMGEVLLMRPKIQAAIQARMTALALREQQAAKVEAPLDVKQVEVASNLAKVSGTRTVVTWTGECVDREALIDAVLSGQADRKLLMPNQVEINILARALHDKLDRIPGLRHIRNETKAA